MRILYNILKPEQISPVTQQRWLQECPAAKQPQVIRLRHRNDQLRSLIGLQLLKQAMHDEGYVDFELHSVDFAGKRKPLCPAYPIDFSISHSAELVVCAVLQHGQVGIDAERIRTINVGLFTRYFSQTELVECETDNTHFFDLWAIKEAVMKAANQARLANLRNIEITRNTAILHDQIWFLHRLSLHPDFKVYVATDKSNNRIISEQRFFTEANAE